MATKKQVTIKSYNGYKIACFPNSTDEKHALRIAKKMKADGAVLSTERVSKNKGFILHFVSNGIINTKRLVRLLVKKGKTNDLYKRYQGASQSENSSKVYSANDKFLL